jgi:hypothetical protein
VVQSQLKQIVRETLSQKRAGGVVQGVGPEFKHQYCRKPTYAPQTMQTPSVSMGEGAVEFERELVMKYRLYHFVQNLSLLN